MAWGYGKYAGGRSRRHNARRRYNARRRSRQMPEQSSAVARFLKSPEFADALLGAMSGIPGGPAGMLKGAASGAMRGSWRGRRPPREEGEGHPGGWSSRGKRRGY